MSRLDKLILELCPNGAIYKELGGLISRVDGSNRKIVKSKIQSFGKYPVYTQGASQKPDGFSDDEDAAIRDVPLILYGDHTNSLKWIDHNFIAGADGVKLIKSLKQVELNDKFLYYCLRDKMKQIPDGYARHFAKLRKLSIPIPPLEAQKEIVNILDKFTQLEAELSAELSAELEARRRQYEFYRNQMLTFDLSKEVKWSMFGDVASIKSGKNKDRKAEAEYSVFGSTGIIGYSDEYAYEGDVLLIARVGAYAGQVNRVDGKYDVSDNTLMVKLIDSCSYEYFYHLLVNMNLNQYASGGGQPLVTAGRLKNLQVPVPVLSEQVRIAETLDKFYKLVNNISEGLPAEIAARRKQYEYYRTKLLTFQELK